MYRTMIGIAVGLCGGAAVSLGIDWYFNNIFLVNHPYPDLSGSRAIALLAGVGGLIGAIAGGVGDLRAFGRRALAELARTHSPEADYRERNPPISPPS